MPALPATPIRREQMLIAVLIILILIIAVVVIIDFIIPKFFRRVEVEVGPKPPAFLSVPLPSLRKIEEAAANPMIDELKFYHPIFVPGEKPGGVEPSKPETLEELAKKVKVEKMGRSNPFIPFEE